MQSNVAINVMRIRPDEEGLAANDNGELLKKVPGLLNAKLDDMYAILQDVLESPMQFTDATLDQETLLEAFNTNREVAGNTAFILTYLIFGEKNGFTADALQARLHPDEIAAMIIEAQSLLMFTAMHQFRINEDSKKTWKRILEVFGRIINIRLAAGEKQPSSGMEETIKRIRDARKRLLAGAMISNRE